LDSEKIPNLDTLRIILFLTRKIGSVVHELIEIN
jgi:hypothetical protein